MREKQSVSVTVGDIGFVAVPSLVWCRALDGGGKRSISNIGGVFYCGFPKEFQQFHSKYHSAGKFYQCAIHPFGNTVL